MLVNIRSSNADKAEVTIESPDSTVADLKAAIEAKVGIPQAQQRLIYKGKVMSKEENTLESYGITNDGDTVHMVKGATAASSSATPASSSATSAPAASGEGYEGPSFGVN